MQYQLQFGRGQPDEDAIKQIKYYEALAIEHDPRGYCVCTSEGKDSRVLGHLMRRAGVKHFYLHNITGIDPPELIYFQRRNFEYYKKAGYLTYDVMPAMSMWRLIVKNGIPPLRTARYCCRELKERYVPEQGGALLSFGVRKYESVNRAKKRNELEIVDDKRILLMPFDNGENRRVFETCYQTRKKHLNPLAYWTDADIWGYSEDAKLEQCSLYKEGFKRLGCVGCPMASEESRRMEFCRWPAYKGMYIRALARTIARRTESGLLTKHATAEEWFEWWLTKKARDETNEDQLMVDGYEDN